MAHPFRRARTRRYPGSACRPPGALAWLAVATLLGLIALFSASPRPAHAEPNPLPVPPPGGLTQGVAGTTRPAEVVAAQEFAVETVSMLVPETQTWLVYVPGAPDSANTLSAATLEATSIVTVLRAGTLDAIGRPPQPPEQEPAITGDANVLASPPPGGLVHGLAGTNDPATFVARQQFPVESVSTLDVASQTWLIYVPFAPPFVSTLQPGMLDALSVVTVRREAPALPPAQPPPPSTATPLPERTPTPAPDTDLGVNASAESVIFASINEERTAVGLDPLILDPALVALARAHSRDMIERGFFSHVNPDGEDPFERMRAAGVEFGYGAENILSSRSGAAAHATFMDSTPHRSNILSERYRRIGIGAITQPGGGVMVTEMFAD